MSKDEHAKGKGLAIGAAVGAVAGVVTGILFAPKSGKETRKDVKDTAVKVVNKVEEESKKVHSDLNTAIQNVEKLAKEKGNEVADRAKDVLKMAEDAKNTLTTKLKEFGDNKNVTAAESDLKEAVKKAEKAQSELAKLLKK